MEGVLGFEKYDKTIGLEIRAEEGFYLLKRDFPVRPIILER